MTASGAAILGCEGLRLSEAERRLFRDTDPWGFILFARNIDSTAQVAGLTEELRDSVGRDAPIFVDQEGGRVQRLRPPLARDWAPPLEFAQDYGPQAARAMYLRYRIIAAELRAHGIDGNCAPMLDVARRDTHRFLRNRCYGETLDEVTELGRSVALAHLDGGVLPVIKHMPGHGLARLDSHLDLPRIEADRKTLEAVDFAAFRPFADLPLGMTAHLVFEAYDDAPATISPEMIGLIRDQIGFDGLLMTDDISMEALSGTVAERGAASIAAGCDLVLHCNGEMDEMVALMDRVGTLSDAAVARADRALAERRDPGEVDITALTEMLEALPTERSG
ncbi:glycoside hydrolase family 3 N-terminal domain-containing protein [Litorisediminicola beolgyonensis]|uniref:beta-N-acetylhexosaminidase n=1 Tax=Litorisediminicola beolgyonensis TaxID=1173614 RepID=A0ABW3ZMA9_9RHOB